MFLLVHLGLFIYLLVCLNVLYLFYTVCSYWTDARVLWLFDLRVLFSRSQIELIVFWGSSFWICENVPDSSVPHKEWSDLNWIH